MSLALQAAPLPDNVRDAVEQVRKYDYTQPRTAPFTLEQFTPKADAEQRAALASLLAKAATAPDTTPLGRTILCQHLALVAGDAEKKIIEPLLQNPKTAEDARLVLQPLGAPPAPPTKENCLAQIADTKPATRVAGITSLARFYPNAAAPSLLPVINDADPVVSATAIRLTGKLDAASLASRLPKLDAPRQTLALGVLAEHKAVVARNAVASLVGSGDELVRLAAIHALGALGDAASVPVLSKLASDPGGAVKTAAENALAQLNAPGVDDAIAAGICSGNVPERLAMINAAAARVNTSVVPALLTSARDADESVQAAAFKALGKLGNAKIYSQLVEMLPSVRNAALETAIITAGRRLNDPTAQLAPLLALLQQDSLSVEAQAAAMRTLAPIGGADALASVRTRLASSDAKLKDAAARALCEWSDVAALDDLKQLAADATASALHRTLAERAVTRLTTTKPPRGGGKVAARPSQSSAARRAALAKSLPKDTQLLVYLDCGPEKEAKAASGETLRVARGKPWQWADEPAATVAFDGQAVLVEATGLNVKKHYQLGFTWWDHDGNGRAQSVWIGEQQAVEKTSLPKQEPASFTIPVPAAVIKNGKVAVEFRREAASNAVVSELWLVECSGNVPAAKSTDPSRLKTAPTTNAGVPATPVHVPAAPENVPVITTPVVKFNGGAAKKILVVTGLEYPGHKWRETAPVLAEAIGADKRLEVSVVEDPKFLASGTGILPVSSGRPSSRVPGLEAQATGLLKYDAIVLNYQNHNVAAPEGALANLKSAVEGGTGLVLFHFACGAFIDWKTKTVSKDFLAIAGRVWNPKLRGHDPYGAFKVSITDAQHPITKGLSDFETTDELYTCLDGDVPVQVLAKATSKVDKKDYPMVFVLTPGKGRAFHCVLGHDVKALNGPVQQLYRRGTAWAAGLEPSTQKGE